ncbi:DUF1905 domain-containing protein [Sphingomonas sp.]|uniref:DUF1905 domain-containing protein n=1 Tax=Sphingomonas sp. TaxID=28214 RepID=UPI00286CAEAC|nr:DUF1905 domain-containing protein [Sphingomonas sp.]
MITVTGPVWLWSEGKGHWHFLTVPPEEAIEIKAHSFGTRRGFGSARVEATINPSTGSGQAVTWRTSVFPQKSGGYILPIKAAVRAQAGIAAGDEVICSLELL